MAEHDEPRLSAVGVESFAELACDAMDLFCLADFGGRFVWLSPRWTTVLGWSLQELRSTPFIAFVHPDDVDKTVRLVETLAAGGRAVRFSNRYRTADGGWRWLEWWACKGADGLIKATARDETTRQESLRQLDRSVRSLRLAEEVGNVGHWSLNLLDRAVYWSPQIYRIHGRDPAKYRPTLEGGMEAFHPDDREEAARYLSRVVEHREAFEFELRIIRADGEVRRVGVIGRPELDDTGERVVGVFGVLQDVTDRHALHERLSHAEKMASVGTLAAGVAHEINNPLSYIQSNAAQLAEELSVLTDVSSSARLRDIADMIDDIQEGTQRIGKIVRGLKTFSRVSERREENVDIARTIETATRLCGNELRHRARLVVEIPDDLPRVVADEAQMVQVAVNLIVNGAQAIREGDVEANELRIRAGRVGSESIFFDVADTGDGMSPEVLRRAFSPFFTTKARGVGTGLGLSICHGIIHSFGGNIDVESIEGKGTSVRVVLPVAKEASPPVEKASPRTPTPVSKKKAARVLIVDDDAGVARSLKRLLREYDAQVEVEARDALRRLRAGERFDVILCDVMMPSLSGPEFYAEVVRIDPELARSVIMVTGGAFTEEGQTFLAETAAPIVEKPIEPALLREAIEARLQARRG